MWSSNSWWRLKSCRHAEQEGFRLSCDGVSLVVGMWGIQHLLSGNLVKCEGRQRRRPDILHRCLCRREIQNFYREHQENRVPILIWKDLRTRLGHGGDESLSPLTVPSANGQPAARPGSSALLLGDAAREFTSDDALEGVMNKPDLNCVSVRRQADILPNRHSQEMRALCSGSLDKPIILTASGDGSRVESLKEANSSGLRSGDEEASRLIANQCLASPKDNANPRAAAGTLIRRGVFRVLCAIPPWG
jgi:hypothetical protein